jgi:hypothetical protein
MTTRNLIRELLVSHMNARGIKHVPIKEFTRKYKPQLPGVDIYRIVYGLGLNDPLLRIEKDEETTYVVMG